MNSPISSDVYVKRINDYDLNQIHKFYQEVFLKIGLEQTLQSLHSVLIKPNLLGAHSPEKAVTTHPAMIEAMIIYLKQFNLEIFVGDSPGGIVPVEKVWQTTGIEEVCKKHNVHLIQFGKKSQVSKTVNGIDFQLEQTLFDVDAVINIAKMKTHSLMLYTGCVKNLYGFIPGMYKSALHKQYPFPKDFSEVLSFLYSIVKDKIVINILDGIVGMEGEGPAAGKPRAFQKVFISKNALALDFSASRVMGFKSSELDYLQKIAQTDNWNESMLHLISDETISPLNNVSISEVRLRKKFIDRLPKGIKQVFNLLFNFYPFFDDSCKKCGICVNSCPVKALELRGQMSKPKLLKDKCIKCMCCHELCPYHAVSIKKTFLAKLFIKSM